MNSRNKNLLTRFLTLALVAFVALPLTAFAQGNGRGRGKPTDVFVNGHDARDGRLDKNNGQRRGDRRRDNDEARGRDRNRDNDEWRRQREERNRNDEWRRQQAERNRNDEWRRNQDNNDHWRRRNGNNGGYGNYGGYGNTQLRQTALNAGYNNGIQEGRKDRSRGDRFDYRDEGDYQRATEDYSSRLGDRELYKRYFREGFANGYEAGYRGY